MTLAEFIADNPFRFEVPELDDFVIEMLLHEGQLAVHAYDSGADYGFKQPGCFLHGVMTLMDSARKMMPDPTISEAGWEMSQKVIEYREQARPFWQPEYLKSLN